MSRWAMFLTVVLGAVLLVGCEELNETTNNPTAPPGESAKVVNVIDGDTIDVRMDGDTYRVRYIGVNTPERDEKCYRDATEANADLVDGETVTLVRDVSDTDQYGRLLRYVYVDGTFVNAELVEQGYAESRHYPPDTAHNDTFDDLEAEAKAANRGCHPSGVFD